MLKRLLKKSLLILSFPLRYTIRYELRNQQTTHHNRNGQPAYKNNKDIAMVLHQRATESTADYVEKHMKDVDSVPSKLELLTLALSEADLNDNQLICEFGVYSGATINHIASYTQQTVYGFDSFDGLPERWRDGFNAGHFKVSSLPEVRQNVTLISGWFDETLPDFAKDHSESIGFLHVDCDLYSSAKVIFQALSAKIHPGCVIVFDEYFNYPEWKEGEFKAFREFLQLTKLKYEYIGYNRLHQQVAVKIKGN